MKTISCVGVDQLEDFMFLINFKDVYFKIPIHTDS